MKGPKHWFNRDFLQAILAILAVIVIGAALLTVSGCAVTETYRPRLEAGFAKELDSKNPVVGNDPVGVVRIQQPLWAHDSGFRVVGEYLHLSSVPDQEDRNTVDQLGLIFSLPLGRRGLNSVLLTRCLPEQP